MILAKTLILPGLQANILERPATILTASQTPSALFPLSRLVDGRPSQEFIFPALLADEFIQADINQVLNGLLDLWDAGLPKDWVVILTGTGIITQETISFFVSGSGARLTNLAAGNVVMQQDVVALAGEPWRLDLHARTSSAGSPNEIEVQNLTTAKFLDPAGAWVALQDNVLEPTATALTQQTFDFTVEPFSITRRHFVKLRLRLHMDAAAASVQHNYDNVLMYPGANLASVHGHNIDPRVVAELRSSSDGFAGNNDLEATFQVEDPTFYASLAATVFKRFWRIPKTVGINSADSGSLELGEAVLGNAVTLLGSPRQQGIEIAEFLPQEAVETRLTGEQWRMKQGKHQQRTVRLQFNLNSTKQAQLKDEFLRRTNDGVDQVVVVVDSTKPDSAVHGRKPAGETRFQKSGPFKESFEILIQESPFGPSIE